MTPFLYPKSRHIRRETPRKHQRYQTFKKTLRTEFENQCVYCRLPDTLKGTETFGVDHYKPRKLFFELALDYENLFYACNCCNSRKGAFWPTQDELARGLFIPNPCDHVMFEHLKYVEAEVKTKSPAGGFCEDLLDLNDQDSVDYRKFVLGLLTASIKERDDFRKTLELIDARISVIETDTAQAQEHAQQRLVVEAELKNCLGRIRRLLGKPDDGSD